MRTSAALPLTVVTTHAPGSMGWGGAVKSGTEMASIIADLFTPTELVCCDASYGGASISLAQAQAQSRAKVVLYRSRVLKKQGLGLGAIPALSTAIGASRGVYVSGVSTWPVTLACIVALALRKPYIVSLHGGLLARHMQEIRSRRPLKRLFYAAVVLPLLRQATMVRASSDFEAREAARELPRAEIVTVPNTFEIAQFPFSAAMPKRDGVRLIYVGRLEPDKGLLGFLKVWQGVAGARDSMVVVGSGSGEYAASIESLAASDPRIELRGEIPKSQVLEEIQASHALVLASGFEGDLRENFGNVVVEALAVGRPALVTAGLAWDQLPSNAVGWTFAPEPAALASRLSYLLTGEAFADAALPARCRGFAEENFSSRAVRRAVVEMVRRCMELHTGVSAAQGFATTTS